MKRFVISSMLTSTIAPSIFAGRWDSTARAVYVITKEPEKAISFVGFLLDLFLMCIPVAIVAGIVSLIVKSVFDLDKDAAGMLFCVIGGVLLVICLIVYFFKLNLI